MLIEVINAVGEFLLPYRPYLGFATFLVSLFGALVMLRHVVFLYTSKRGTGMNLRSVFATDAALYLMTVLFGLGAYMEWPIEYRNIVQAIRIPIFVLNIYVADRLYKHFLNLK
jgi:hypothetical protein